MQVRVVREAERVASTGRAAPILSQPPGPEDGAMHRACPLPGLSDQRGGPLCSALSKPSGTVIWCSSATAPILQSLADLLASEPGPDAGKRSAKQDLYNKPLHTPAAIDQNNTQSTSLAHQSGC